MRSTAAIVDLGAMVHNLHHARSLAPKSRTMAVVKANAYGHGAIPVARALESEADALAVACMEEALELRDSGITAPLLVLEGLCQRESLALAAQHQLWLMIHSEHQLAALEQAKLPAPIACWLKVDTGMHRLGFNVAEVNEAYGRLTNCANCAPDIVLTTHFACADEPASHDTHQQIERFNTLAGDFPLARSAANSAAVLAWPESHYQWIRPGYMLYGNSPFNTAVNTAQALRPAMTFGCDVIALRDVKKGQRVGYSGIWQAQRDSVIATLNAGYADGYPRHAQNGTPVLINGHRAPLVGRVSMDMITVDVTDLPPVTPGDTAVLWGPALDVGEVARWADTIGYELTTRMPIRTPRIYR